jgi:hypothetical protein
VDETPSGDIVERCAPRERQRNLFRNLARACGRPEDPEGSDRRQGRWWAPVDAQGKCHLIEGHRRTGRLIWLSP